MEETPASSETAQGPQVKPRQLRVRDRRRGGERRKCTMFVEGERRCGGRRGGADRRQIAMSPTPRLIYPIVL